MVFRFFFSENKTTNVQVSTYIKQNDNRLVRRGYKSSKDPFARSQAKTYEDSTRIGNSYDIDGRGGSWINCVFQQRLQQVLRVQQRANSNPRLLCDCAYPRCVQAWPVCCTSARAGYTPYAPFSNQLCCVKYHMAHCGTMEPYGLAPWNHTGSQKEKVSLGKCCKVALTF